MAKYRFIFLFSVLLMCVAIITYAAKDEATVEGVWNFDNGDAEDTSGKGLNGNIVGDPEVVDGIVGKALLFDGEDDGVKLPDSAGINTIAQPNFYTDRTIAA